MGAGGAERRPLALSLFFAAGVITLVYATFSHYPTATDVPIRWTSSPPTILTPHPPSSSYALLEDTGDELAYRHHLELTTSLPAQLHHSPTLTFSNIYVLSLPHRTDRRAQMLKLGKALGLNFTFVDAVRKEEPFIGWIAERVKEVKSLKADLLAKERGMLPSEIGGLGRNPIWLSPTVDVAGKIPFPPLQSSRYPSGSWVSHLETTPLSQLLPSSPSLDIDDVLRDPMDPEQSHQLNAGAISTFWGHTRVLKRMIEAGDESALILEDDVDIEWDLENLWATVEASMPRDWSLSFLGHCYGYEQVEPQYGHPLLHRSTQPLCLHAYALSLAGAQKLFSLLQNPWTAYLTPIDTAVPSFIAQKLLQNAFSVEPQLVIQRKDTNSDIQKGVGAEWRGFLRDSTWERIRRDEGERIDKAFVEGEDPATRFRYRLKGPPKKPNKARLHA